MDMAYGMRKGMSQEELNRLAYNRTKQELLESIVRNPEGTVWGDLSRKVYLSRFGSYPSSWMGYPEPHYDEDDVCQCPDHVAMRLDKEHGEGWMLRNFLGEQ